MSDDLAAASRRAIDHYRAMAETDPEHAEEWTALADELDALRNHDDGQGALL